MSNIESRSMIVSLIISTGFILGPILSIIFIFTDPIPLFIQISLGITLILVLSIFIRAVILTKKDNK